MYTCHVHDGLLQRMALSASACCTAYLSYLTSFCVGGAAEAEAAYKEAHHAIFDLGVSCHRHVQPRKKGLAKRWEQIEMWPMTVSHVVRITLCIHMPLYISSCSVVHDAQIYSQSLPITTQLLCLSSSCRLKCYYICH